MIHKTDVEIFAKELLELQVDLELSVDEKLTAKTKKAMLRQRHLLEKIQKIVKEEL